MIDRLALLLLIAGCALFGAIILIELAPAGTEDAVIAQTVARSDVASPAVRPQTLRPEELVGTALARPLFNSTRRPPQDAPSGAAADDLADARLTGIVTTPGRRIAIFAVSGDKPLKVAEGEAVSGWRIDTITPREVSLSGPSGTKTLQPKLDPNLASPPAQPPIGNPPGRPPTPPAAGGPRVPAQAAAAATARPARPPPGVPVNTPGAPRPARLRQQ
jgi:general secretion pathway protein N